MRFLFALLLIALLPACSEPAPAPEAPPEKTTAQPEPTAKPEPIDPKVEAVLRKLAEPTNCNRLTGCAPADELRRMGRDAVAGLIALCRHSGGDKYWRERAFELLGVLGGEKAERFLLEKLVSGDPLLHSVAMALGHARPKLPEAPAELQRLTGAGLNAVAATGVDYALARLGDDAARGRLAKLWKPETLAATPVAVIHVALDALRWLDARESAATVRAMLRHPNLFVRRQALDLVRDWRLRAALPDLILLLEDPSAGVRERALDLLQRFTGQRHKQTRAQWEAWCRGADGCELPE